MFTVKIIKHTEDCSREIWFTCDSFESRTNLGNQKNLFIFWSYERNPLKGDRKEYSIADRIDCENVVHIIEIYNCKGALVESSSWNGF